MTWSCITHFWEIEKAIAWSVAFLHLLSPEQQNWNFPLAPCLTWITRLAHSMVVDNPDRIERKHDVGGLAMKFCVLRQNAVAFDFRLSIQQKIYVNEFCHSLMMGQEQPWTLYDGSKNSQPRSTPVFYTSGVVTPFIVSLPSQVLWRPARLTLSWSKEAQDVFVIVQKNHKSCFDLSKSCEILPSEVWTDPKPNPKHCKWPLPQ